MKKTIRSFLLFTLILTLVFLINSIPLNQFSTQAQAAVTKINKTQLSLYEGHTSTLKITGTSSIVKWSSSDKTIASVTSAGKVTTKNSGTAIITGKVGKKKYQCRVTVLKVSINITEKTLYIGDATILKVNDKAASVTWSSNKSSVAYVSKNGAVIASSAGKAIISGKISDKITVSCIITVEADPNIPTKLELTNVPTSMKVGEKQKISINYTPSTSAGSELYWEITDENGFSEFLPITFDEETMTIIASFSGNARLRAISALDETVYVDYNIEISDSKSSGSIEDNSDTTEVTIPGNGQTSTPVSATNKPMVKTFDGFTISQDATITIFDAPMIRMSSSNFDYWDEIYYTLDGSTPTERSQRCYLDTHIFITDRCVLKMMGVSAKSKSEVLTIQFIVKSGILLWGLSDLDIDRCLYVMKNCPSKATSLLNNKEQELCIKANAIISSIISPTMSDYDKVKAIHDYICNNVAYTNEPNVDSQNAYGALINGYAVCGGYAEAYRLLVNLCDIDCMIILGNANGQYHSWNLVKLDNEWYHVDCTWDDIDYNHTFNYLYFLIDDTSIATVHNWNRDAWVDQEITCKWPVCTSTKYIGDYIY